MSIPKPIFSELNSPEGEQASEEVYSFIPGSILESLELRCKTASNPILVEANIIWQKSIAFLFRINLINGWISDDGINSEEALNWFGEITIPKDKFYSLKVDARNDTGVDEIVLISGTFKEMNENG